MSLKVTFDKNGFHKVEEQPKNSHKPEFKKFNMRFHNIDLQIIDAIAKRNKTSRSQILNKFIEFILKSTLNKDNFDIAKIYCLIKHTDSICKNSAKSNPNFSWESWYNAENFPSIPMSNLQHEIRQYGEYSTEIKNLQKLLAESKK